VVTSWLKKYMEQNTQTTTLKQCIPRYDTHQSYDLHYISAAPQCTILSPGHHKISHITSNIYIRVQTVKPVDFAHDTRHSRPNTFLFAGPFGWCVGFQRLSLSPISISTTGWVAQQEAFQDWSSERILIRVCAPRDCFSESVLREILLQSVPLPYGR